MRQKEGREEGREEGKEEGREYDKGEEDLPESLESVGDLRLDSTLGNLQTQGNLVVGEAVEAAHDKDIAALRWELHEGSGNLSLSLALLDHTVSVVVAKLSSLGDSLSDEGELNLLVLDNVETAVARRAEEEGADVGDDSLGAFLIEVDENILDHIRSLVGVAEKFSGKSREGGEIAVEEHSKSIDVSVSPHRREQKFVGKLFRVVHSVRKRI